MIMKIITELGNRILNIENTVNHLGKHIADMWDFVHKSNFSNVILAYLFSQGVSKFRFDMVIQFNPKNHIAFLSTDKGYYMVHVFEENEMVNVDARILNYEEYVTQVHDNLILLAEQSPEGMRKQYLDLAQRWIL